MKSAYLSQFSITINFAYALIAKRLISTRLNSMSSISQPFSRSAELMLESVMVSRMIETIKAFATGLIEHEQIGLRQQRGNH